MCIFYLGQQLTDTSHIYVLQIYSNMFIKFTIKIYLRAKFNLSPKNFKRFLTLINISKHIFIFYCIWIWHYYCRFEMWFICILICKFVIRKFYYIKFNLKHAFKELSFNLFILTQLIVWNFNNSYSQRTFPVFVLQ